MYNQQEKNPYFRLEQKETENPFFLILKGSNNKRSLNEKTTVFHLVGNNAGNHNEL